MYGEHFPKKLLALIQEEKRKDLKEYKSRSFKYWSRNMDCQFYSRWQEWTVVHTFINAKLRKGKTSIIRYAGDCINCIRGDMETDVR